MANIQPTENWKPVVGYEGIYEVSDQGRVRSLDRVDPRGHNRKGLIRVLAKTAKGYERLNLTKDGQGNTKLVHHLVLEAFVGPKPEGQECRHLNGIHSDNRLSNLQWGTPAENSADTVRLGKHYWRNRTHCKRGHLLGEPNTVPGGADRSCYACQQEHVLSAKHSRPFSQESADRIYARLLAGTY